MKKIQTLLLGLLWMLAVTAWPQAVPPLINFQGQLVNATNGPLPTADYRLTFSIWDAHGGGSIVWGPQIFDGRAGPGLGPKIPVVQGYFNVMLGPNDTNSRPISTAFSGSNRYLQIQVENNPPLTPRQQLLSAPYALKAEDSSKLAGRDWSLLFTDGAPNPETSRIKDSVLAANVVRESGLHHLNASDGLPSNAVFVDANGNVGIGTTTPADKLAVRGTVDTYISLSNNQPASLRMGLDDKTQAAEIGTAGLADLRLGAGAAGAQLFIKTNGNVGIGTSNPSAKLQVTDGSGASGNGGIIQVGKTVPGSDPKLIRFGDGPAVSVGEELEDNRLQLRGGTIALSPSGSAAEVQVNGSLRASSSLYANYQHINGPQEVTGHQNVGWTPSALLGQTVYGDQEVFGKATVSGALTVGTLQLSGGKTPIEFERIHHNFETSGQPHFPTHWTTNEYIVAVVGFKVNDIVLRTTGDNDFIQVYPYAGPGNVWWIAANIANTDSAEDFWDVYLMAVHRSLATIVGPGWSLRP